MQISGWDDSKCPPLHSGHIQRKDYFAFGATAFAERSVAIKAPVGLLSGRAVCVSRWRGFAPTSSAERSKRIFTGRGRKKGKHGEKPLPSAHCVRSHLPQGDGFSGGGKLCGSAERRPLGGAAERSEAEGVFCAQKSPGGRVLSGEERTDDSFICCKRCSECGWQLPCSCPFRCS